MPGYEESYPNVCVEVGLTCEACTSHTAGEVARLCKGLQGKTLGQMFVQLYPNPACSRMHSHFAQAYRDASPKGVQRETSPVRIAAVA
jgi:hypothetical protein